MPLTLVAQNDATGLDVGLHVHRDHLLTKMKMPELSGVSVRILLLVAQHDAAGLDVGLHVHGITPFLVVIT